jgi:3-hydroxyacyl-CoA dehydrogenase/enoyl-CoA hydratase/3-hydroxybutyryl-CoA epimerase
MKDGNIRTELDADGILLACIDMPGRAMNVFSKDLMDALEQIIARAETDPAVHAVVLTSGKPAFLAGADLEMIKMFSERARSGGTAELNQLFGHLGRLFRRLELNPKPFVAAINGLALGGGLEVCMACHGRIVADDPAIQLGLPEIKLGLLPGAGGTQRLPRLIGTVEGLRMLLKGEPVSPQQALDLHLVDEVVPADQLIAAAKRKALSLHNARAPWDRPGARFDPAPFAFDSAAPLPNPPASMSIRCATTRPTAPSCSASPAAGTCP